MNLDEFKARRTAQSAPQFRDVCARCRKAVRTCYCHVLRPFVAPVSFVILQHYDESRNAIATARMAHLSILNSRLIVGNEFRDHGGVNALIRDENFRNVLLYPSRDAAPLDEISLRAADEDQGDSRPLMFWILDAKWSHVPKMLRSSPNVRSLPAAKLTPHQSSQFRIRKQPAAECLSTIEAMFLVLEHFTPSSSVKKPEHHALIDVFQHMVKQQLEFVRSEFNMRHQQAKLLREERRNRLRQAAATQRVAESLPASSS